MKTGIEKIAKRISEIHDEVESLKSQRETNLDHCHGPNDECFKDFWNEKIFENKKNYYFNCLTACYAYVKEGREHGEYTSFDELINMYGCKNCIAAYEAKKAIGKLKQERGRLVGNITKIGKHFYQTNKE